ncbi:sensor histidine kinase [Helicovermis profundi]
MNSFFLEKYFIYRNEKIFLENVDRIRDVYNNDSDNLSSVLKSIDRSKGVHISIINNDLEVVDDSFNRPNLSSEKIVRKIPLNIAIDIKNQITNIEDTNKKYLYKVDEDFEYGNKKIQMITRLDKNKFLVIEKPINVINENANISNDFFAFTGVIAIVLGNIFLLFFTKKITKPIIEISGIAKSISNLDFTKKYKIKSEDELGELGSSINLISNKLNETISELIDANGLLKKDNEKKKHIDDMRKLFVSSVSHELKTPIGLIKGHLEGIKFNIVNDIKKQEKYLDIAIDEADRMDKLVKDLLVISEVESDVKIINKTNFNITILIEEILDKYQTIFIEKGIKCSSYLTKDYFVNADLSKIEQVLINYINNAIEHVDENRKIEIREVESDNAVRIIVKNFGKNIEENEFDNIWTSFYKVDKSRTRVSSGSGLGLSIVKSILDNHVAKYGVNNIEKGVEFWLELPTITI